MSITVHQFPCLSDNYGFLVRDDATGLAACIDTPEASVILRELAALGWKLDLILNTHWHPDHAGGNAEIKAASGATVVGPAEVERIGHAPDRIVAGGDQVMLGQTRFEVIESGGHTLGHVAFFDAADHVAFVGDTLFALGCGRLFEGTPAQMQQSLDQLAALPDDTLVCCAHEYTLSNLKFARAVEPHNAALLQYITECESRRRADQPTLPSRIAIERDINPFLRTRVATVAQAAHGFDALIDPREPAAVLAALRQWKNEFR